MKQADIIVSESDYENWPNVVDVNLLTVNLYDRVLIVCPREGAKKRLSKSKIDGLHKADVLGWWDLVDAKSTIEILRTAYDAIIIIDPERIGVKAAREMWQSVILKWS